MKGLTMRKTLLAFLAGAVLATGLSVLARTEDVASWHQALMMAGAHSGALASSDPDDALKHLYAQIDPTDAQKAQIEPLVKQAMSDLQALHSQLQSMPTQLTQALTQSPVDRASLEAVRVAHLQVADQTSKRLMQLVADVGDLLTPAQRKLLADHVAKLHGFVGI
jgi:periplasmic protein CpxP/Spy